MICNSCKSEFDNINGLKFCPYCGTKIEEPTAVITEQVELQQEEQEKITETVEQSKPREKFDTLTMPAITEEQIKGYKKDKFFGKLKAIFKKRKLVISIATVVLMIAVGAFGYSYLIGQPVDEGRIKGDITGKTIVLPKGTNLEIKKNYIKSFSIKERITNKSEKKDDIKAAVVLNNGSLEVNTLLSLQYIYEGKDKWTISDKIELVGETAVKPLVGMDEKQILEEVKKANINVSGAEKSLSGEDVKTLAIASRTPDYDNFKEEVMIDAAIDSGLVAASGKVKCQLNFEDEVWKVASIERNSSDDFALALSPAFSQDKLLEVIKKDTINQTVTHPDVFGGKGFYVSDSFTKSINVGDKRFDAQNGTINVSVKKQNEAGELKSTLSTDYTFAVSFTKVDLLKKTKPVVDGVTVNEISKDFIVSSIANREIESNNIFFWYSNSHKITPEEAKSFKTDKVASPKGLANAKYVYGSVTYKDGSKQKTTNVVAVYYLVYDSAKGYNWKLDRIVGEDSSNYKMYNP